MPVQPENVDQVDPKYPAYNPNTIGWVYIIHLNQPWVTSDGRTLRHYVGFSKQPSKRLWHHRNGTGATFLLRALELGINFTEVVQFKGTKSDERRLKIRGHIDLYCPICNPDHTWKFTPKGVLLHEQEYKFVDL